MTEPKKLNFSILLTRATLTAFAIGIAVGLVVGWVASL